MNHPVVLTGAYGRLYRDAKSALIDYQAGKDFRILGGPYCSIRDFPSQTVSLIYYPEEGKSLRKYVEVTR
jgi:hypothetical protein